MNFSKLSFGGFSIQLIGLFWAIAFGWFAWQVYNEIKKDKKDPDFFVHHFWTWTVVGLIVGRLIALALMPEIWDDYGYTSFFAVWEGKINLYGFLFGFLGFMWWDMRKTSFSFRHYADLGLLPFLKAAMFMDIAFFLTGDIYGKETALPWGVRYETFGVELIVPVHPISIYALICHFFLYKWLQRKKNAMQKTHGKFFMTGIIWFLFIDFFIQFLRFDQTFYIGIFRIDQLFAALLLATLVYIYHRMWGFRRILR